MNEKVKRELRWLLHIWLDPSASRADWNERNVT